MRRLPHWLEELSSAESIDFNREIALSHAAEGGATGERIAKLIRQCDLKALCEFEMNYEDPSLTAYAVMHCRQALAFFQKLSGLDIGLNKDEIALQKFLEAEELCRETNAVFKDLRSGRVCFPPRVCSVLHAAQRKISRILGPVPMLRDLDLHFGPGATRGTKRTDASIRRKIAEKLECSEELFPSVAMLLGELPHLAQVHAIDSFERVEFCDGSTGNLAVVDDMVSVEVSVTTSKLNFVAKNAKTSRSICVEPGLNAVYQLGVGKYMAKRLAAFGIDIRDQTVNQRRALEGSLTGALATLDLSSASDTVSKEIVFELLPLEWANFLARGRSARVTCPDGRELVQEKFSSMGNGFTFPLETLIFWGLAASCCESDADATVYGDDIVVPTSAYPLLTEVLHYAGFMVNKSKSYSSGPFRESCGKDYFRGIDVRPFYMKDWVSAQALFVLHNFYVRHLDHERAKRVATYIHPSLRIYGPDGYGDGHLIGDHMRDRPEKYRRRGYSGYFFSTFSTRQRKDTIPSAAGDYVLPSYTIYRRSSDDSVRFVEPSALRLLSSQGRNGLVSKLTSVGVRLDAIVEASLPLPSVLTDGVEVKALTLPGFDGYKRISIYTLGT